jgi:hypothetical protein
MGHAQKSFAYLQGQGHRLTLSVIGYILLPLHNFFIHQWILKIHGINVDNNKMMCHAQHLNPYLQGQGYTCLRGQSLT